MLQSGFPSIIQSQQDEFSFLVEEPETCEQLHVEQVRVPLFSLQDTRVQCIWALIRLAELNLPGLCFPVTRRASLSGLPHFALLLSAHTLRWESYSGKPFLSVSFLLVVSKKIIAFGGDYKFGTVRVIFLLA